MSHSNSKSQKSLFEADSGADTSSGKHGSTGGPTGEMPQTTGSSGEHETGDPAWNEHQQEIFLWTRQAARGEAGARHARIRARAGTGKTTTAVKMADIISEEEPRADALFCSFSRKIAEEIGERIDNDSFESNTMHSIGLRAIYKNVRPTSGDVDIQNWKYMDLVEEWARESYDGYREDGWYKTKWDIFNVVNFCQNVLADPTDEDDLHSVANRLGVPIGPWLDGVEEILERGLDAVEMFGDVSFGDMIYYTAVRDLPLDTYDWILIDEAQDLNPSQRLLIHRMIGRSTKSVWIGDENQAIFQFQGADPDGFLSVADHLSAEKFRLPVSYRCPKSHVREASRIVPDIEAPEGAKEGTIESADSKDFFEKVRQGDVVLCRTNAPLMKWAVGLVEKRRPAEIVGDNLPNRLKRIIYRVCDIMVENSWLEDGGRKRLREEDFSSREHRAKDYVVDYEKFPHVLDAWAEERAMKLSNQGASEQKISNVLDQRDCIETCYEGFSGPECPAELIDEIQALFETKDEPVYFSTVHKAKGKEYSRVHLIASQMPLRFGDKESGKVVEPPGEANIKYVALTRSSSYINVFGDLWWERDNVSIGDPLPGEEVEEMTEEEREEATEKAKQRIADLLKKASSTTFTPEEKTFRAKAEELLDKYGLSRAELRAEGYRLESE